jgi:hypothetical protein
MRRSGIHLRVGAALAALFAGGTLFGTCELQARDALITTSQSLVLGLFETALQDLNLTSTTDTTTGN